MPRKAAPRPPPTREELLAFIRSASGRVSRRELVRAFGLSSDDRPMLRKLLAELEQSGAVERGHSRRVGTPGTLPDVTTLVISGTDEDGDLLARPLTWTGEGSPPRIFVAPPRANEQPAGVGDRILARLKRAREGVYEARTIRRLTEGPATALGVFEPTEDGGGFLKSVDRRQRASLRIEPRDTGGAEPGELVLAELLPRLRPYGPRPVRVTERLGAMDSPKALSLVAIYAHGLPHEFPGEAKTQAAAAGPAPLAGGREDQRALPLVTIDGEDARDFDDAVWAEPTDKGGWHIAVAIADVAWYVRPGDALDREAQKRGNSVYFPDRVVPMLPEELSNGWCSLKPREDRPCLVAEMWIDGAGNPQRHVFRRAMMRSAARLTYDQVQRAIDGQPDDVTGPLLEPVLRPLYGAWHALLAAREKRGSLELDLPERKVIIGSDGNIERVVPRERHDSHRVIEDFMIAANVAAATQIETLGLPCMYRVHDRPAADKLVGLHEVLSGMGLPSPRGQALRPEHFNRILAQVKDSPDAPLVNELILRSQAQAVYAPENIGHFGLGLAKYAHFTSPIRRYADLLVHRALITGLKLGEGGFKADEDFVELGRHISTTERRAAAAEREAVDRFTARFLADKVGSTFKGRISGVTRFGLFVALDETGADGLLPASNLPGEQRWRHDARMQALVGRGRSFRLGDKIEVVLEEAAPLTGGLVFGLPGSGVPARGAMSRKAPARKEPNKGARNRRKKG